MFRMSATSHSPLPLALGLIGCTTFGNRFNGFSVPIDYSRFQRETVETVYRISLAEWPQAKAWGE